MPDEQRPHDPGRHLLGPHVVGQRVVVRRLVRGEAGPTGGPAMTDLLGICLSWEGGICLIEPADGASVEIAIGDIVSGKPVPPRPSVRHRVSVADAEAHTASLWPDLETAPLGAWTARTQPRLGARLVRRANSCLAVGEPAVPWSDALASVSAFYGERDRPALLHVEADGEVEEQARRHGWTDAGGEAEFRLASLARVRRGLPRALPAAELAVTGTVATATVGEGCDPLAECAAAVDGDWLGIHGVVVDPAHRRRGLATAVVAAVLEWGAERGARTAWLHVETDNAGGLGLWSALGFESHHTMRYLSDGVTR